MKKYYFEVEDSDTSSRINIKSNNDGFTAYELLGIFEHKKQDILDQMKGIVKPNYVTRNLVEDDTKPKNTN